MPSYTLGGYSNLGVTDVSIPTTCNCNTNQSNTSYATESLETMIVRYFSTNYGIDVSVKEILEALNEYYPEKFV